MPLTRLRLPLYLSLSKLVSASPLLVNQLLVSTLSSDGDSEGKGGKVIKPEDPPDSPAFVMKLCVSVLFILLGGVFAGLTLALMGSDDMQLRVLAQSSSDPKEQKQAARVLRLLERGRHWVLVVLLLSNVIVNESLPIFLDSVLGGGAAAVLVSTTMIVIFGEIIPQSICVRYGLSIGSACAPFVLVMMYLMGGSAKSLPLPFLKALGIVGEVEADSFRKAELKTFLQFHREGQEPLRDDEITILNGVLSLNDKKASQIMTRMNDVLTLAANDIVDHAMIDHILLSGFSRIPVHEVGSPQSFMGMLLVKKLISYNPEERKKVSDFPLLSLPEAGPDINCFQALDYFQTGRAHLLLISEHPGSSKGALGIVSLEDLVEEIIGEEIIDETDRYTDNQHKKTAKRQGTADVMRGIIERHKTAANVHKLIASRQNSRSDSPTRALEGRLINYEGVDYAVTPIPASSPMKEIPEGSEHGNGEYGSPEDMGHMASGNGDVNGKK